MHMQMDMHVIPLKGTLKGTLNNGYACNTS